MDRPQDAVGDGDRREFRAGFLEAARQAEVEDLDLPVVRQHDVLGLQVPVDDAGAVGRGEA